MLDAGVVLEKEKRDVLVKLGKSKDWPEKLIHKIKCQLDIGAKDGPYKLSYGSDFPYKGLAEDIPLALDGALCRPSFAKGGLSTVWGAAVLPYIDEDIAAWPISVADLAPHYEEVLSFMPLVAGNDELVERFPLYTKNAQAPRQSKQASLLLSRLRKNKKKLYGEGFRFGSSRLAVQLDPKTGKECVSCGLCLYGCPYELIYSSAQTLEELRKNKRFLYVPDVVVERVEDLPDGAQIIAHGRLTKEKKNFSGEKVFVGCGAVPSTKIMLASLEAYEVPITFKDSQQFLIPCLTYRGVNNVTSEKLHTLCQMYVEILDKKVDPRHVHLQIYTYNDVFEQWLKKKFKFLYPLFKFPFRLLMGRVVVIKAFLHSDSSGSIVMNLHKANPPKVTLQGIPSAPRKRLRKIVAKIIKNTFALGLLPILPILKGSKPGGANHYGGSFPMAQNPQGFQSDVLGRPCGFKNVHLIDSSVFPSIASQTITFTIMANAHRIASQAVEEFKPVSVAAPLINPAASVKVS